MSQEYISGKTITEIYRYFQHHGGSYNDLRVQFSHAGIVPNDRLTSTSSRNKDKFLDSYIKPLQLADKRDAQKLIAFIEQAVDFSTTDSTPLIAALQADGWQRIGARIVQVGHAVEDLVAAMLHGRPIETIQREIDRARLSFTSDPADALTAASSMIEATYKYILHDMSQPFPTVQDMRSLSKVVHPLLNISPEQAANDDFRSMLQGTISIVQSIGSIRTRLGDAHGAAPLRGEPLERHARLAVSVAGALCLFLLETYEERKGGTI